MSDSRPSSVPSEGHGPAVPTGTDDAVTDLTPPKGRRVDTLPRKFGRYRIQDCLGRGGMGAVFRAHDTQLDRTVALKVPFLGDDDQETRQRFYREARAAATLHHANICPVFDVGEQDGLPYLTMAFVEGRSLARILKDGTPLTPTQAAVLVRKLALAMAEAHAHGVIHRDLKPANVLLRSGGEPVIMDFGLARRGDDRSSEGLTRQGDVIGTLEYMSPEQLEGDNAAVGPRADVYALGVVLYEVLTGRRPFTGSTTSMLTAILLKPPPRPSELRPDVPDRLEEICLKAMARKPADRFINMTEFAAALTDYLKSPKQSAARPGAPAAEAPSTPKPAASTRPIRATAVIPRPDAPPEEEAPPAAEPPDPPASARRPKLSARRKKKAKKKSPLPLVVGGIAGAVVLVVLAVALWPGKSDKPVPHADAAPPAAPVTPAATPSPQPAPQAPPKPEPKTAAQKPAPKPKSTAALTAQVRPDHPTLAVGETREVTVALDRHGYDGPVTVKWDGPKELHVSPAGPLTVKPGQPDPKLTLRLVAPPSGEPHLAITATPVKESGRGAASVRLGVKVAPGPCLRVLDVAEPSASDAMAFSPDATLALVGGSAKQTAKGADPHAVRVWDLRRGEPLSSLAGHTGVVNRIVVSGDGKSALTVSADETVALWDLARGRLESRSPKQPAHVQAVAVSPDGKRALVAYPGMLVRVDLDRFQAAGPPVKTAMLFGSDLPGAVRTLAVSADRKGLAGGVGGKLFLLDLTDKAAKPKPLAGHEEAVRCAAFAPSGNVAATGGGGVLQVGELRPGKENAVCLWDTAAAALKWKTEGHASPVVCVAFAPDGKRVASGSADGEVKVWDAAGGKPVAAFKGHTGGVRALAFAPDGKTLASGSADGTVRQWKLP